MKLAREAWLALDKSRNLAGFHSWSAYRVSLLGSQGVLEAEHNSKWEMKRDGTAGGV